MRNLGEADYFCSAIQIPIFSRTVFDCYLAIDIQLMPSADGTVFGSHRKNLEAFSDGFPDDDNNIIIIR